MKILRFRSFFFFSFLSQKWSFFWLFNSSISLPTYFLREEFFVIKFRRTSSSNEEMQPLVIIHNHCEFFLDEEVLHNKIIRFLGKNYNYLIKNFQQNLFCIRSWCNIMKRHKFFLLSTDYWRCYLGVAKRHQLP